ncbi:hypothetical protein [Candidatus Thiosymbion oneisti]|uniref:hypothetical protein n=1 Tax=Candidatus Thiosymbion oneisti TaxID=589554 RepID=UPI000B7F046D|nr:hypothetical protein [Candidatus Thiosymbion oneisti]
MLPPVDIAYIAEALRIYSEALTEVLEDRNGEADPDPRVLLKALSDLFDHLRRLEDGAPDQVAMDGFTPPASADLHSLGNYGIDLLARLAALAGTLLAPPKARAIEELALPLACWIARRGGELGYLEPVVNGAAHLANRLMRPSELEQLYGLLTEVVNAVDPRISQHTTSADSSRPWRVLLLNRAIVATRSHQPALMEEAFESVIEYLPEEAPTFFREGMEQMDALNYPSQVRDLMQRFYQQCCGRRVLH